MKKLMLVLRVAVSSLTVHKMRSILTMLGIVIGVAAVSTINLQARSSDEMDVAQAQVTAILRAKHGLAAGADNDFQVRNQADILSSVTSTSNTFTTLLGSIAAISLLVGGSAS